MDTADEVTDISMSYDHHDVPATDILSTNSPKAASISSHTLESDSLEDSSPRKDVTQT